MGLYIALGFFWLFSAFKKPLQNPAIITIMVFTGGLVLGRLLSYFIDGQPQPILLIYIVLEFVLFPIAYWVYKQP